MKQLFLSAGIVICLLITACSKKNDAVTPIHTIQVDASAASAYNIKISTVKFGLSTEAIVDTKTALTAAYQYNISLEQGDKIIVEIKSNTENTISYSIEDNGTSKVVVSNKQVNTFSTTISEYTAQ